jgi:hypothetical protein
MVSRLGLRLEARSAGSHDRGRTRTDVDVARQASRRARLRSLAAGAAKVGLVAFVLALPQAAAAAWTRVSAHPSSVQPFVACAPSGGHNQCRLIEDPTRGIARRGPVREGAITTAPEQQVSPALQGSGIEGGYSPEDLRGAYGLGSASAGSGQTVAVVDAFDDPNGESDLGAYRSQYGIAPCTAGNGCFRKVDQTGGSAYPQANSSWTGEISLDLDMVSAICPNCHILLVEATTNQSNDFAAAEDEAVALGATEISNSFGNSTPSEPPELTRAYDHRGIPITAAGGDSAYGVGSPASNPHVIAVGGTSLVRASDARGWSESAWSGTGSGCSAEAKPAWQTDSACSFRTTNDVAAVADVNTPVSFYDSYQTSGSWHLGGGTSVAAPIVAAAMALADPYTRSFDGAQALYLEAAANGTAALDDVITGSNGACGTYLCEAGVGYDGPTGLGSLSGAPTVSPSQVHPPAAQTQAASEVTQTSATLNATVNPNGGPIGRCAFYFGSSNAFTPCASLPGGGSSPVAVSAHLAGLLPATTYYFRIVASNLSGTASGAIFAFTTQGSQQGSPAVLPARPGPSSPAPHAKAAVPAAALVAAALVANPAGAVTVKVSCPAGESFCAGTITLRTLGAVRVRVAARRYIRRTLTLAVGSFRVAGGRSVAVVLHLSRSARALLARLHLVRALATVVARDAARASHTGRWVVTVRRRGLRG